MGDLDHAQSGEPLQTLQRTLDDRLDHHRQEGGSHDQHRPRGGDLEQSSNRLAQHPQQQDRDHAPQGRLLQGAADEPAHTRPLALGGKCDHVASDHGAHDHQRHSDDLQQRLEGDVDAIAGGAQQAAHGHIVRIVEHVGQ